MKYINIQFSHFRTPAVLIFSMEPNSLIVSNEETFDSYYYTTINNKKSVIFDSEKRVSLHEIGTNEELQSNKIYL